MSKSTTQPLEYYARPGLMTIPGQHAGLFDGLPTEIPAQADPDSFGIFDMRGMWFIRGDLVQDLVSLNKIEILPWDGWGLMSKEEETLSADDMALLDHIAELTVAIATDDEAFAEVRALYEDDARLCVPPGWPSE